ncbi:hypothetical protein AURDEDRAFT_175053 [Auricularia subglabra TFB-10046 SS5]|nr:hypothetical protein AURDEDRAFT_175053 [Auricularia subglabra TFB-10046 SS5]
MSSIRLSTTSVTCFGSILIFGSCICLGSSSTAFDSLSMEFIIELALKDFFDVARSRNTLVAFMCQRRAYRPLPASPAFPCALASLVAPKTIPSSDISSNGDGSSFMGDMRPFPFAVPVDSASLVSSLVGAPSGVLGTAPSTPAGSAISATKIGRVTSGVPAAPCAALSTSGCSLASSAGAASLDDGVAGGTP